jgi:hypothetical protein
LDWEERIGVVMGIIPAPEDLGSVPVQAVRQTDSEKLVTDCFGVVVVRVLE